MHRNFKKTTMNNKPPTNVKADVLQDTTKDRGLPFTVPLTTKQLLGFAGVGLLGLGVAFVNHRFLVSTPT
jgi:hypothetical protein